MRVRQNAKTVGIASKVALVSMVSKVALGIDRFKDSFGIVWFTPMLLLLIEFDPFSADFRKAPWAKTVGVRVSSPPK
jgi:hypothetical protein